MKISEISTSHELFKSKAPKFNKSNKFNKF